MVTDRFTAFFLHFLLSKNALQGTILLLLRKQTKPSLSDYILLAVCCAHAELLAQNQTALCTTAGENLTAVGGRHSLAEAMDLGRMELLGLISTLCHGKIHLLKFDPAAVAALTRRRTEHCPIPQLTD